MTTATLLPVRVSHRPGIECWWCGGDHSNSEHIFLTPEDEPRAICDCCIEENDWILTAPSGLLLWQFSEQIKLAWAEERDPITKP